MRVGLNVPGEVGVVSDPERVLLTGSAGLHAVEQRAPGLRFDG